MSESLLKIILELFAIVAKEDEVTQQERNNVVSYLRNHISDTEIAYYEEHFEHYTNEKRTHSREEEILDVERICQLINQELTQQQKAVLLLDLVDLIIADGQISASEEQLLFNIGNGIYFPEDQIGTMINFVNNSQVREYKSDRVLIIHNGSETVQDQVKSIVEPGLDGYLSFLHVPQVDTYFIKYNGNPGLYVNGVPLLTRTVSVFPPGSTIRGERVSSIYYSDVISQFLDTQTTDKILLRAANISFAFKGGKLGLRDISLEETSGKLVGIMGASGAGKSTLLNVLNGLSKPADGSVTINGIDIHKFPERVEGVIGFVPQDDLLIEELTVQQNLFFAAKLCFSNRSASEINTLIDKTLRDLGLAEIRSLKVGSPLQKTISGGQRKRLNIALELLRTPDVLFLDEPTSGLSSRDSENIMDLLKELSLMGKLVFVVIHQPSSDIFKMFDRLVILDTGGYLIYYGNPVEASVYFKEKINMLDREKGACPECGNVNPEQIFNIIENKVVDEYGRLTEQRKVSPVRWNELYRSGAPDLSPGQTWQLPSHNLHLPSLFGQFLLFGWRDLSAKLADRQYLLINLLEAPLLAGLLAYIVRYFDQVEQGSYLFRYNLNIPAYFFISIIVALFMGLTGSAEEIIKDRKILKREAFLHLSRGSYLFSKIIIVFLFSAIQTFLFVLIGDFILEIDGIAWEYWLILFSTSCFANLLGLNISSAFKSAITIYILIPLLLIPQLILSGVVVSFDHLNPHLSSKERVPLIGEIMASRWAFEAIMVGQYKHNNYNREFYDLDKQIANYDYQQVYYIPELQSVLSELKNDLQAVPDDRFRQNWALINSELTPLLPYFQADSLQRVLAIEVTQIQESDIELLEEFTSVMKKVYQKRFLAFVQEKDARIAAFTSDSSSKAAFFLLRDHYHNEAVTSFVRNTNKADRIIRTNGKLLRKINPIYMDPQPHNALDFREQFFVGTKHFAGYYFDTVYFNILIIWLMTLFLILTLYFDVLRRIISGNNHKH